MSMSDDEEAHLFALHMAVQTAIAYAAGRVAKDGNRSVQSVIQEMKGQVVGGLSNFSATSNDPAFDLDIMKENIAKHLGEIFTIKIIES